MPELIDTHVHLQWDRFDEDRDAVIERAQAAGVVAMITLATNLTTSEKVLALAEKHPAVFAAVGIHPTDVADAQAQDLSAIAELAKHPKVVAIGEIGMDFYWDKTHAELQERLFIAQIEMAADLDLPVVVHNRDAGVAIQQALAKLPADLSPRGVFHCFTENRQYAEDILRRGFHISFTGNLTYPKSDLGEVARQVPLARLLLETDSPFLPPVPKRGQRNEPAYIRFIAEKHAELRGVTFAEICRETTESARRLFDFKKNQ